MILSISRFSKNRQKLVERGTRTGTLDVDVMCLVIAINTRSLQILPGRNCE